jgi:hypothetical protein
MKHTIHAHSCVICGKGLGCRSKSKVKICLSCSSDRDNLPEWVFCKGIAKNTGKRCRAIVVDGYCNHHKKQGENNEKKKESKNENKQDGRK